MVWLETEMGFHQTPDEYQSRCVLNFPGRMAWRIKEMNACKNVLDCTRMLIECTLHVSYRSNMKLHFNTCKESSYRSGQWRVVKSFYKGQTTELSRRERGRSWIQGRSFIHIPREIFENLMLLAPNKVSFILLRINSGGDVNYSFEILRYSKALFQKLLILCAITEVKNTK